MKGKKFAEFLYKGWFLSLVIFVLLIMIAFLEVKVAIPGFVFFVFLLYYNFRYNYKRKGNNSIY